MKKKIKTRAGQKPQEVIIEAIEKCLDNEITPSINLIIFYPEVRLTDLEETIDSVIELYKKAFSAGKHIKINFSHISEEGREIEIKK